MSVVDLILSAATLACLLMAASAAFGAVVALKHIREHDELNRKLLKTDRTLAKMRRRMAAKEKEILQLQKEIAVLRPVEARVSAYHDSLVTLRTEAERAEMAGETKGEDEAEKERRRRTVHLDAA